MDPAIIIVDIQRPAAIYTYNELALLSPETAIPVSEEPQRLHLIDRPTLDEVAAVGPIRVVAGNPFAGPGRATKSTHPRFGWIDFKEQVDRSDLRVHLLTTPRD